MALTLNLKIEYNLEKNIQNWKQSLNKESYNVNWIKFLPSDISLECAKNNECLKKYLKVSFPSNKIKTFINLLNQSIRVKHKTI